MFFCDYGGNGVVGGVCAVDDEVDIAGDRDEALVPRGALEVLFPSETEVREHNLAHFPYRGWCRHCVEGRGRETRSDTDSVATRDIPRVSADYMYIGSKTDGSGATTILSVKDDYTNSVFLDVVPRHKYLDKVLMIGWPRVFFGILT